MNSDLGCLNTITKEVVVHENPKVFLEILETCEGSETTFISSIFLNDGFITNWNWDFGDKKYPQILRILHISMMNGENLMLN